VRLIVVTVKPEDAAAAERVWKQDGAPLMIRQPGCQSEERLRSTAVKGAYISYAEGDSQASIDRYLLWFANIRPRACKRRLARAQIRRSAAFDTGGEFLY
jgi:hypothetical protein